MIGPIIKALTVVALDKKVERVTKLAKGITKLAGKVIDIVKGIPKSE